MKIIQSLVAISILSLITGHFPATAQPSADPALVTKIIEAEYNAKSTASGTLDIFNDNKIYNLKLIAFEPQLIEKDNQVIQKGNFRDINTGDTVAVEAVLNKTDDTLVFGEWKFAGISENKIASSKKDYTDEEIQDFMKDYFVKKTKFTSTFDLYDESKSLMRNLELGEMDKEVRKFGSLAISTISAKDQKTGDNLKLDITVENKDGVLSVQSVRMK